MQYEPDAVTLAEVRHRFCLLGEFKPSQVKRVVQIREIAGDFAEKILLDTPPGREQSIALTKLEEMVHWASMAILRNE